MKTQLGINCQSFLFGIILLSVLLSAKVNAQILENDGRRDSNKPETEIPLDIYWHVKAYRPEAKLLNVKAIDKEGNIYNVKAIQNSEDISILNVKALVNDRKLSVKMIVKGDADKYYPVKAIDEDGTLIDIKAITEDGQILDVKGFAKTGNVVSIRAINKDNNYYNIIAISPKGKVNTLKGVKMFESEVEGVINGISIFAHIKAIKQD